MVSGSVCLGEVCLAEVAVLRSVVDLPEGPALRQVLLSLPVVVRSVRLRNPLCIWMLSLVGLHNKP